MPCKLLQIPTPALSNSINFNQTCLFYSSPLPVKSSLGAPKPPTTKQEAILQAKNSLLSTLKKPLNNTRLTGKFKKQKQPRYRVEIPVVDDSPSSLSELALDVFGEMLLDRKGTPTKILVIWSGETPPKVGNEAFSPSPSNSLIKNLNIRSILDGDVRITPDPSFGLVVFLAPALSEVDAVQTISDRLFPRPVVIFNPQWSFEEEKGNVGKFMESFEVVYCFMGLEVRGILSKRKGVIFKCVSDGVLSGEKWNVFVEEGGEMRLASTFKTRPSIAEVENVLYNLMAMNSPIAKSSKFLKDLVSNVTRKK